MLAGSRRASHFPSLSLCFPSVGTGPWEAQRKRPHWRRFPAVCTGGKLGVQNNWQGPGRGRGDRDSRNYSGLFSPHTHAPQGSDGKRPSCLPGKDVSCAARLNPPSATANPSQKPPLLGHLGAKPHTPHLAHTAPLNHPSFLLSPALVSCCPNKSQNTQTSQD